MMKLNCVFQSYRAALASNLLLRNSSFKNLNLSQTQYGSFDKKSNNLTPLLQKKFLLTNTIFTESVCVRSLDIVRGQMAPKLFLLLGLLNKINGFITSSPKRNMGGINFIRQCISSNLMDYIRWPLNDSLRRMSHETEI